MQNYTSTETVELKAGSSGSASVLFIMSILGLACAAFTLAMPGAGDQLMADACSALSCEASGTQDVAYHFSRAIESATPQLTVAHAAPVHATALPAEVAMSAADQQWQVAQAFNAPHEQQPATIVSAAPAGASQELADADTSANHFTPLAYLADAVPALH